jgi:hypothetical protein
MIRRVQAHTGLAFLAQRLKPRALAPIHASPRPPFPSRRLLGQCALPGSWLDRLLPWRRRRDRRSNRPAAGCEFINEMIHWSAVERFGKLASDNGRPRRYAPANLKAALEGRMLIADERLVAAGGPRRRRSQAHQGFGNSTSSTRPPSASIATIRPTRGA